MIAEDRARVLFQHIENCVATCCGGGTASDQLLTASNLVFRGWHLARISLSAGPSPWCRGVLTGEGGGGDVDDNKFYTDAMHVLYWAHADPCI